MPVEKASDHWTTGLASLLWPILAFVVLFAFWAPLHDLAERLPDVIDRSQTIDIASVKLELDPAAGKRRPSPPVAKVLKGLYAEDLRLMPTSSDLPIFVRKEQISDYRQRYAHLNQLELVVESESTMTGPPSMSGYTVRYTPLGAAAKAYLVDVIVNLFSYGKQVKQATGAPVSTEK